MRFARPPAGDDPWCVDLGHAIVCMRTSEVCELLGRGALHGDTRVWRDGMAAWTPLGELEPGELDDLSAAPYGATPTTWAREGSARTTARLGAGARRSSLPWVAAIALFVVFGALSTAIFTAPPVAPAPHAAPSARAR